MPAYLPGIDNGGTISPENIIAIGNTGHGNGLYLLDKQRQPLRPAPLSVDSRTAELMAEWQREGIADRAWPRVYQQNWPGQTVLLLAWLRRYEADTCQKIGHTLLCKDYLKFCLTGEINTDFTDISGTGLFDIRQKTYARDVLALCGIEDILPLLPEPASSIQVIGHITPVAAAMTGLKAGTPVVAGIFDVSACALSSGVLHPGQACIVAGTWSINEVVTADIVDNPDLFMNSVYLPGHYLLLEASPTSASNLEWYVTQFGAVEQAEARQRGISVYAVSNEIVARTPETTVLFHPFLFGSNTGAAARAGFYGMGGWYTRDHLLRAVYESIVYTHLSHFDRLRRAGVQVESARLTGGDARSQVWAQMFAGTLDIPMEIVRGEEIGARGAAMCAGIEARVYRDYADAAVQVVQIEKHYTAPALLSGPLRTTSKTHPHTANCLGGDGNAGITRCRSFIYKIYKK